MTLSRATAALAAAGLVLGLAAPAHAHWSFTKWGMTADQVIKASKGKAKANPGGPGDRVMDKDRGVSGGVFDFEGRRYMADFYFEPEGGGLKVVRLNLLDQGQCDALGAEMEKRYGASKNKYHGEWTDPKTGDTVFFSKSYKTMIQLPCYLSYRGA